MATGRAQPAASRSIVNALTGVEELAVLNLAYPVPQPGAALASKRRRRQETERNQRAMVHLQMVEVDQHHFKWSIELQRPGTGKKKSDLEVTICIRDTLHAWWEMIFQDHKSLFLMPNMNKVGYHLGRPSGCFCRHPRRI